LAAYEVSLLEDSPLLGGMLFVVVVVVAAGGF
jgi:hypothetical protein